MPKNSLRVKIIKLQLMLTFLAAYGIVCLVNIHTRACARANKRLILQLIRYKEKSSDNLPERSRFGSMDCLRGHIREFLDIGANLGRARIFIELSCTSLFVSMPVNLKRWQPTENDEYCKCEPAAEILKQRLPSCRQLFLQYDVFQTI